MPIALSGVLYCRRRFGLALYPCRLTVNDSYLFISPGRNEARSMRNTLDGVAAHAAHPALWMPVGDAAAETTTAILAEAAMLWGYRWSWLLQRPRYENAEFRRSLRHSQWRVLLVVKQRAVEEMLRERSAAP